MAAMRGNGGSVTGRVTPPVRLSSHGYQVIEPSNGMPERKPYIYGGTDTNMSEAEVAAHLSRVRRTIAQRRGVPLDDPEQLAADLPVSAPYEWHQELAEEDARLVAMLATSSAARDAACQPPTLIVLTADETGTFSRPETKALAASGRRCRRCGYLASKCGGQCR